MEIKMDVPHAENKLQTHFSELTALRYTVDPVSYTHLDVYKRQIKCSLLRLVEHKFYYFFLMGENSLSVNSKYSCLIIT